MGWSNHHGSAPLLLVLVCVGCGGGETEGARGARGARVEGAGAADSAPAADVLTGAMIPDTVRLELIRLGEEDQAPRHGLTPQRMQDTAFLRTMIEGDAARTERLKAVVARYGWPDSTRVGADAAGAAFLILQHSPDHAFQKEMLPTVEALAGEGALPRSEAALLVDRVLMHDGLPQRYGTQFSQEGGRLVLHPVEDEEGLEERRRAMDLPSMDDYVRMLEEFYQMPVGRDSTPR